MKVTSSTATRIVTTFALAAFASFACGPDSDRPPAQSSGGTAAPPVSGGSSSGTTSSGGATSSSGTSGASSGASDGGSSSGGSSGTTSSGGSSGTAGDSGTVAPQCQNVPREGSTVAEVSIAAAPPAATGGSISAGKYYLTTWEAYTGAGGVAGPTGETRKATLVVSANMLQLAATDVADGDELPVVASSYTKQGTSLDTEEICPLAGRPLTRGYTASSTELILLETFGATTRRFVYTKQ